LKLFVINDSINIDILFFERNNKFSLEYNALWWEWDISSDKTLYYAPKKATISIIPKKTPFIGVAIRCNEWNKNKCTNKKIFIEKSKSKFILD